MSFKCTYSIYMYMYIHVYTYICTPPAYSAFEACTYEHGCHCTLILLEKSLNFAYCTAHVYCNLILRVILVKSYFLVSGHLHVHMYMYCIIIMYGILYTIHVCAMYYILYCIIMYMYVHVCVRCILCVCILWL